MTKYLLAATRYRRLMLDDKGKVASATRFFKGDVIDTSGEEEARLLKAGALAPLEAEDTETEPVIPDPQAAAGAQGTPDDTSGQGGAPDGQPNGDGDGDGDGGDGDGQQTGPTKEEYLLAFDVDAAEYDDLLMFAQEHGIESPSKRKKDLIPAIKAAQEQAKASQA